MGKSFLTIILLLVINYTQCQNLDSLVINKFEKDTSIKQVLMVKYIGNCCADIKYLMRKNRQLMLEDVSKAYIGNGIGKEKEDDLKTPTGTYTITGAFGFTDNPGTKLPYTKITPSIYACDEDCEYYNQIIDTDIIQHKCHGEHMIDYKVQYKWGFTINYNVQNEYPKGSCIFIHCKGYNKRTLGCVALDSSLVLKIMKNSDKGFIVHIYE